jgi:hypothetical protein
MQSNSSLLRVDVRLLLYNLEDEIVEAVRERELQGQRSNVGPSPEADELLFFKNVQVVNEDVVGARIEDSQRCGKR